MILAGQQCVVPGTSAPAPVLFSDVGLSFWGGVDCGPATPSRVVDHTHPLRGRDVAGATLCVPNGRGSCTGSQVVLELVLAGHAPAAIVTKQPDAILALGALVAEMLLGGACDDDRPVPPVVALGDADYEAMRDAPYAAVVGAAVVTGATAAEVAARAAAAEPPLPPPPSADALLAASGLVLTDAEARMLRGDEGEAKAVAMRLLARAAANDGAPSLLAVTQAHIDGCTDIGPGGLRFAQTLQGLGARVAVPTTLNSNSVDRRQWRALGVPRALGESAEALGDAYLAMGCSDTSFTCAPYLLPSAPALGDQIAWGESNAVVFSNSVLGARTQKYADFLDICCAITGRAPKAGPHLDAERRARVVLDAGALAEAVALGDDEDVDAFFPALGYLCGLKSEASVPVVVGLEDVDVSLDDLKAFSAAFGSTASVAMFHMLGHTPEAPDLGTALGHADVAEAAPVPRTMLTHNDLEGVWRALNSGVWEAGEADAEKHQSTGEQAGGEAVQLVALGNPHLSLGECAQLAALCADGEVAKDTAMVLTMGRAEQCRAEAAGHVAVLEAFGAQVITDTCWCMLTEPVVPPSSTALITNSAKYAHYAPGLLANSRRVHFNSLRNCVVAAKTGRAPPAPEWLRAVSGGARRQLATLGRKLVCRR